MSADNFIAVFPTYDSLGRAERWYVAHGMMPSIETPEREKKWRDNIVKTSYSTQFSFNTIGAALEKAHDMNKDIRYSPVEYGVIEL